MGQSFVGVDDAPVGPRLVEADGQVFGEILDCQGAGVGTGRDAGRRRRCGGQDHGDGLAKALELAEDHDGVGTGVT
jgi:hypothetical protein